MFHGVIPHRAFPHPDGTLLGFVQPGNQRHQRGLARTSAPKNPHHSPGGNPKAHVPQDPGRVFLVVAKVHMVQLHTSIPYFRPGIRVPIREGGDLVQDLSHPSGTGHRAGHHHEHHGDHHKGHHDLQDIGEIYRQVSVVQGPLVHHAAAEPQDGNHRGVDNQHHDGHIDDYRAKGPLGRGFQVLVPTGELLLLPRLLDEGLHHTNARQIFLHHQIQRVGLFLEGLEQGAGPHQNDGHRHRQNRQGYQKHLAQPGADTHGEHQGRKEHHRRADHQPHPEHQGHLKIAHVVGQARHQGSGREPLDVGEGEVLDMVILRLPQIRPETHTRKSGQGRCSHAQAQGHQGHPHHLASFPQDICRISRRNADVHNVTHDHGNQEFKDRLPRRTGHSQQKKPPVRPDAGPEPPHITASSPFA